jgi:serine/threonine protein kinase
MQYLSQIAEALHYAQHLQPPVVHCDSKPENLLLEPKPALPPHLWLTGWTRRQKGGFRMTPHRSFVPPASAFDWPLTQGKLSRRAFLGQLVGLTFVGSSLLPFTTACGTAPARPSTTAQTPSAPSRGTHLYTYRGHHGAVNAVGWSPAGQRLASASLDQTVQVWQAQ